MKPRLALALSLLAILTIASLSLSHPPKVRELAKLFKFSYATYGPLKVKVEVTDPQIPSLPPKDLEIVDYEPVKLGVGTLRAIADYFGTKAELLGLIKRAGYLEALVNASGTYYTAKIEGDEVVSVVELKPILIEEDKVCEARREEYPRPLFFSLLPKFRKYLLAYVTYGPLIVRVIGYRPLKPNWGKPRYVTVVAEYPVVGHNIFGWPLFCVTAKSVTTVIKGVEVIYSCDRSYYWTSWWAQGAWRCDRFKSYTQYNWYASYTRADGHFTLNLRPFIVQRVHAMAWVLTRYTGRWTGGGRIYSG